MKSADNLKEYIRKIQSGGTLVSGNLTDAELSELDTIKSRRNKAQQFGAALAGVDLNLDFIGDDDGLLSKNGAIAMGMTSKISSAAFNMADLATMGDKNFSGGSQVLDNTVHGASNALMSSGNPYAMLAGAALEGVNFLTKAGGQTVEGFNVNLPNTGYGNLGSMDSQSNRSFAGSKNVKKQLDKRNKQLLMALEASDLSEDQAFQLEARMNSVQNVIQNNQIALAGGFQSNLLGS